MTDTEFAAIVAETKGIVLASVRKHLAARFSHAIDDVVQETYFRGYRHLAAGKFREEASLSTWMYAIARNESLRMNARLTREEEKGRRSGEQAGNTSPGEEESRLSELVGHLPEKYRSVMEHKLQGKSEREIAGLLGIGEGTVKSRFSRGKLMLRKQFGGES